MRLALLFLTLAPLTACDRDSTEPTDDSGQADTTAPTVSSTDPTDGASDVPVSLTFTVVFSEEMDPDSSSATAVSLSGPDGDVSISPTLVGRQLTVSPNADLAFASDYVLTVGTELTDLAGNALAAPVEIGFTTTTGPLPSELRLVGRHDTSSPDRSRFSWPGTGFVLRFDGTSARATLAGGGGNHFQVVVDGTVEPAPLVVSNSDQTYTLAEGLADGEHTVEVYRRPEAYFGVSVLSDVEVDGTLLPVPEPTRFIEIIGDSWSTGYGVDGPDPSCSPTSETTNHFRSWGALAALEVGAELSSISYSGKGVLRGFDGSGEDQMITLYDRALPSDAEPAGSVTPVDVAIVLLGGNDLDGAGNLPSGFVAGYTTLLEQVRTQHPDALIACGPPVLDVEADTQTVRTAIDQAIANRQSAGDTNVKLVDIELPMLLDFGCDFHPGPLTHQGMADNAVDFLGAELGW